jgi:acyl phosphate:glycerol-3-phosphate acyltransferase
MLAGIAIYIYSLIFEDKVIMALSLFISVLVIILHRQNIKRLIRGLKTSYGNDIQKSQVIWQKQKRSL